MNKQEPRAKANQRMDKTDRRIASLLQENPATTQTEIARKLGISQSSAGLRLAKLRSSNILMEAEVINYENLGMSMCRVDVDTTNPNGLLDWANTCPLFVNSVRSVGKTMVCLLFLGEDIKTFHSVIDEHLSKLDGVRNYEMTLFDNWQRPFYLKLDLRYSNQSDPPCGMLPFCTKCPSNPNYDGRIWNNSRLFKELALPYIKKNNVLAHQ